MNDKLNEEFFAVPALAFDDKKYALMIYGKLYVNRELLECLGVQFPQKLLPKYCTSTQDAIYQCARWINWINPTDGLDYAYQLIALYVDKQCSLAVIADLIVDKEYPSTRQTEFNGLFFSSFVFWGSVRSDRVKEITKFLENNLIPQNKPLNRFYPYFRNFCEASKKTLKELLDGFDHDKFMKEYLKNKGDKDNE